ncbi:MAG: tetratricopeptide repeat protein [Gammaproteobacteria bacterium]|jgi:predicted negative regulator of RcsB-dependent stress response
MDDYLDEKEQIEEIKSWLKENWLALVAGVIVGFGGLFSWNWYQDSVYESNTQALAIFDQAQQELTLGNFDSALALLQNLRSDYNSSPYTDFLGLLYSTYLLSNGNTADAAVEIEYVLNNTTDEYLRLIATWRLARVNVEMTNYDRALELVQNKNHALSANFTELEGDVYFFRGEFDLASNTYMSILSDPNINSIDLNTLMLKINNLAAEF